MEPLLLEYPRLRIVMPLATAIAVGIFFLRVVSHFEYTPDDTYIYLRTAVNVVQGAGWSFNPGDGSYSVTGPLWAMLLTGGAALGLDPYVVAKTLDATLAALAILGLQLLIFSLTEDQILSAMGAVVMTFDAWLLRWSGSGMETSLAILLTILAFRYLIDGEWLIVGVALGLLVLVRPEYALLAPWMVVGTYDGHWRHHLLRWILPLALMAGIAAAWWIVATIVTGTPLPTTIGSKAGWWIQPGRMAAALWESARMIAVTHAVPIIAIAVALVLLPRDRAGRRHRWLRLLLGWPLILTLAYASQGVQVVSRYLAPALTMLTAAAFLSISLWLSVRPDRMVRAAIASVVFVVITAAFNSVIYETKVTPHLREFTEGMQRAMKPIAYWIREHADPDDEVLAPDIGMVGYISERRVWDPAGLATPQLREAIDGHTYDEVMTLGLYRSVVRPRFVIDRSRDRERLTSATMRPIMTTEMPGLGISIPGRQYVTLYEARP